MDISHSIASLQHSVYDIGNMKCRTTETGLCNIEVAQPIVSQCCDTGTNLYSKTTLHSKVERSNTAYGASCMHVCFQGWTGLDWHFSPAKWCIFYIVRSTPYTVVYCTNILIPIHQKKIKI